MRWQKGIIRMMIVVVGHAARRGGRMARGQGRTAHGRSCIVGRLRRTGIGTTGSRRGHKATGVVVVCIVGCRSSFTSTGGGGLRFPVLDCGLQIGQDIMRDGRRGQIHVP